MSEDLPGLLEALVVHGEVYDLSHPMRAGMPMHPFHHGYSLVLHRRHGDTIRAGGASFANELILTPGHAGTHIDALGHFSRDGRMHGGIPVDAVQTHQGLRALDADAISPLIRRGILFDVAGRRGVASLDPGEAVEADDLRACSAETGAVPGPGDVALVRTGWSRHWDDADVFANHPDGCPGVGDSGASWLADEGVVAAGTDTAGFEVYPQRGVSVHATLLVDRGVFIIENLRLDDLAAAGCWEFLFLALPLPLVGATGSPIRPLALT
jgi:kynurenine formamidase